MSEGGMEVEELWEEIIGEKNIRMKVITDSRTRASALQSASEMISRSPRIDIAVIKMIKKEKIGVKEWVSTDK